MTDGILCEKPSKPLVTEALNHGNPVPCMVTSIKRDSALEMGIAERFGYATEKAAISFAKETFGGAQVK